jgi:hypothetical protein
MKPRRPVDLDDRGYPLWRVLAGHKGWETRKAKAEISAVVDAALPAMDAPVAEEVTADMILGPAEVEEPERTHSLARLSDRSGRRR